MAPSQLSGMKMRNLLFGVILGLLAVVHSTPVNTVTQIPANAEDEVFHEAVTEGFLIDPFFLPSLTTESPKRNTTVQASQQPSSDSKESDMIEGSAVGETSSTTTTPSVSHAQSSTSTVLPRDTDNSSSDSATTQSPQSSSTYSSVLNEALSSVTPDHISVSQTTDPAVSSFDFLSTPSSDLGSGDGDTETSTASSTSTAALIRHNVPRLLAGSDGSDSGSGSGSGPFSSNTETSTAVSTSTAALIRHNAPRMFAGYDSGSEMSSVSTTTEKTTKQSMSLTYLKINNEPQKVEETPHDNGNGTPGWIIIVGFIVGVAALVMLCVAIATRDKWNGPNQASQLETKTPNSSNQQRELEMETFLHKDMPRENGKAAEYTVIPLDELSEKYSSY